MPGAALAQGYSWTGINGPFGRIHTIHLDSSYLYVGTPSTGIFRSGDDGTTWEVVYSGLMNVAVKAITTNASGVFVAGTDGGGVFRSTDNGALWFPANSGLLTTRSGASPQPNRAD